MRSPASWPNAVAAAPCATCLVHVDENMVCDRRPALGEEKQLDAALRGRTDAPLPPPRSKVAGRWTEAGRCALRPTGAGSWVRSFPAREPIALARALLKVS